MIIDKLSKVLEYIPEEGLFTWKISPRYGINPGDVAGSFINGYKVIVYKRKHYLVHRLVYLFEHGYLPIEIDHKDGDKTNNLISNLRDVSHKVNMQNEVKPRQTNTTGYLGVSISNGKYKAQIRRNGKAYFLGYFNTAELASNEYQNKKLKLEEESINC